MEKILDGLRDTIRAAMRRVARGLNKATKGQLSPNTVTLIGLAMHFPIALMIAADMYVAAGVLLIIFGLFDTLDGELARLQHSASKVGMLLDSTTDRMKEIILYIGIASSFVLMDEPWFAVWAVAACGGSLLVSYVNAWGEAMLTRHRLSKDTMNQAFRGGFLRFEIRMLLIVIGLFVGNLVPFVAAIAVLSWLTAVQRLLRITKRLA